MARVLLRYANFDKASLFALQSEDERFRYFDERVDIIKDDPKYASKILDKLWMGYRRDGIV